MDDPIEQAFIKMCLELGIKYTRPEHAGGRIDFYLPAFDLYVEVKAWPTPRIVAQLESVEAGKNAAMVLVGMESIRALRQLLMMQPKASPATPTDPAD